MKRWSALVAACALAGCAASSEPSAESSARSAPTLLSRARAGLASEPLLARSIAADVGPFRAAGETWISESERADALSVRLNEPGSARIELRAGRLTRPLATAHLEVDARAELVDGYIRYATSGADHLLSTGDDHLHHVIVSDPGRGSERVGWWLELRDDLSVVRRENDGALLFENTAGDGLLRVTARPASGSSLDWEPGDCATPCGRATLRSESGSTPLLASVVLELVSWKEVLTPNDTVYTPGERIGHASAFDSSSGRVMLFGGAFNMGPVIYSLYADTWTLNWALKRWEQVAGGGPSARWGHAMAHHSQSSAVVLHGGQDFNGDYAQTWRWTNGAWSELTSVTPVGQRIGHKLVDDPSRGVLVMYGGGGGIAEWNGSVWATPQSSTATPGARWSFAMAFTPAKNVLIFSGLDGADQTIGGTWSWNGTSFLEHTGLSPLPAVRNAAAMVHDSVRDCTVLFGGQNDDTIPGKIANLFGDTWEWTGTAWVERTPITSPPARAHHSMTYDPIRERIIMFGGYVDWIKSDELIAVNETWEYRRFGGTCTSSAECDGATCVDGACCATGSCETCESCSALSGGCEAVLGADDPDSCTGASSCDATGVCRLKLGQSCSVAAECASGFCADGVCCDAACTGACEACDRTGTEGACTLIQGQPRHGTCSGSGVCVSACNGSSPDCVFPGTDSDCGSSCESAVFAPKNCDGKGACIAEPPRSCDAGLACADATSCRTSCSETAHCAAGHVCSGSSCVPSEGTCIDDHTWQSSAGETKPCGAYRCALDRCLQECATRDDCAQGYACNPAGQCVATPSAPPADGCGCRVPVRPPSGSGLAGLTALLAAASLLRRRGAALFVAAAALGCSAEPEPAPPASGPEPAPRSVLGEARDLARSDAWVSRVLAGRGGFARDEHGALTHGYTQPRLDRIAVRLPADATGVVELRAGRRTRPLVQIRTPGAAPSAVTSTEGHALYEGALFGADAIWSVHGEALEQQLLVRTRERRRVSFELELRSDVERAVRERDGALLFVDRHGDGLLRIAVPVLLDAAGARRSLDLDWQLERSQPLSGRVEIELDTTALALPVLLDPVFEVVTWQELTPTGAPPPRYGHQLVAHAGSGKLMTFSGSNDSDDTWVFDAGTKQWSAQTSTPKPPPRIDYAMTADAAGGSVVLFGGQSPALSRFQDTWLWNGSSWTLADVPDKPPPTDAHAMAIDASARIVLYGGYTEEIVGGIKKVKTVGTMYEWQGPSTGWKLVAPGTATTPLPRWGHTLVYDAAAKQTVLFGGRTGSAIADPSVFQWDAAAWSEHAPASPVPLQRYDHGAAYDASNQSTVIFGGVMQDLASDWVLTDETWEWDALSSTWHAVQPKTRPPKRSEPALAHDAAHDRTILFGGVYSSATFIVFGDTWQYRRLGNTCTTSAECEGFACVDGVCCSEAACGSCQQCQAGSGLCGMLQNQEDPDNCSGSQICSTSGTCGNKLGEPCGAASECSSGHCADGVCCTESCSGACQACDLSTSKGTCTLVSGAPKHGSCPGSGACASSCTGSDPGCVFPAQGTACASSCSAALITFGTCDGSGSCVDSPAAPCPGGFACASATDCRTSCIQAADCAPGAICSGGGCIPPAATCETPCAPYLCQNGQCTQSCSSITDCAQGAVCTPQGQCTASTDSDSDSGCGCRTASSRGSSAAVWLIALVLALRRRSVRRRRASGPTAHCR